MFRILGAVEVVTENGTPPALTRRRERCLLAVLLLHINRITPTDRLVELLWEADPPAGARLTLPSHVSRVRSLLAASGAGGHGVEIVSAGGGYRMTGRPEQVDAHRFRSLVDRAATLDDPDERLRHLRAALDLWRGPPMAGAASDWLRGQLCRDLAEQHLTAIERLAAGELARGRGGEVLPELARVVGTHPGHERLVALYMQALHQAGRKADALEAFTRARAYLADELGLDPGETLRAQHQAVLRDQLPSAAPTPPAAAGGPAPVPRQLPADVPCFAGREAHIDQLDALLVAAGHAPTAVVIGSVRGTAGVGKTALAVHWAHRVCDRFPDGQLYVNLRGFDPAGPPLDPAMAVRGFLDALQVPPARIPSTLEAQSGLYRSLVTGRRMLVVLDNARDFEQLRPLLPGSATCLVLVTSRNELVDLVAMAGAHPVRLDLLPPHEARLLLARRLGADRLAAEPGAVEEIINSCARLPLALAIVAAHAAAHPESSLTALAAELHELRGGLAAFAGQEPATNLRTVFSWSYHGLGDDAARLFRLLGLHPGADVAAAAAASLAGASLPSVRPLLAELTGASLVTQPSHGRSSFHDLLRAYAAEMAHAVDDEPHRRAALHRLLDHYLHTAHAAVGLLEPHRRPLALPRPDPAATVVQLGDHARARSWFITEHAGLLAAIGTAADRGFGGHAWRLAWTMVPILERRGQWRDLATVERIGLTAAIELEDRVGQAHTHRGLARAYIGLGRHDDACSHLELAAGLFGQLGDRLGQADTIRNLSLAHERQGRHQDALRYANRALDCHPAGSDRAGWARALNSVGWCHALVADYRTALDYCGRALALQQEIGDRSGQAATWHSIGFAHHHLGDHVQATSCYRQAVDMFRDLDDRYCQAEALISLGDTHHTTNHADLARTAWRRALRILHELGHPRADQVRAKLEPPMAGPG